MVSLLRALLALFTPSSRAQQPAAKNETGGSGTGSVQFFSLRTKLLLFAAALVLIPGAIYGAITLSSSRPVLAQISGAHADRAGKFQAADEVTLFLDEIGDMDVRLQAKLLRVLQEGVIEPLGANRRVAVDVRIVFSTNRNLEQAMREGRFREDLILPIERFPREVAPTPRT